MKVSVIIPTRNEQKNIAKLLTNLKDSMRDYDYEAVVVDDSDDDTVKIAGQHGAGIIIGQRKGLGQAILDGIRGSDGEVVVVMDADRSHPVASIPSLVKPLSDGYGMTIGSRYVSGGSIVGWTIKRKLISLFASAIAYPLSFKRDNTSGFFALNKSALDGVELKADSWKIMLEILIKANPRAKEIPIQFIDRQEGESKFNRKQVVAYLKHLIKLYLFKYKHLLKFVVVGASGVVVNFGLTYLLTDKVHLWYLVSSMIAIGTAASSNYVMNHYWTFNDKQENNPSLFKGWLKYLSAIGVTEVIYIGLMFLFTSVVGLWYMLSAVLSLVITTTLRYITADRWIWGRKREKPVQAA
jgi:dolichol-phosphate mannosyltransferase